MAYGNADKSFETTSDCKLGDSNDNPMAQNHPPKLDQQDEQKYHFPQKALEVDALLGTCIVHQVSIGLQRPGPTGRPGTFRAHAKLDPRSRAGLGLGFVARPDMDMSKNIPINLELDDDQIRIAEESDQDHFDPKFKDEADSKKTKIARCKYCKKSLTVKPSSRTAHLNRHSDACVEKYKKDKEPTQSTLQLNKDGSSDIDPNDENFKVLEWWHKCQPRFPVLSQLARDVLTISVSMISSESAFSTTKMIVDERRTSLAPEMVEGRVWAGPVRPNFGPSRAWLGPTRFWFVKKPGGTTGPVRAIFYFDRAGPAQLGHPLKPVMGGPAILPPLDITRHKI
ncbi:HAT, C-terminal dimerization domain containing protein [Parasponia andersonii]|uniref:HAT, C-terminal dimerization domain containing protein n=1 Tax=Parasponia andersonii TaxID=3476 RepID=A0A2P5DJ48_PARAD|nr:HAT, C-terminal dimerization domain containing protein [Parasponia andersonii]